MPPQQVFSAYDHNGTGSGRRYRYCPVCAAPLVVAAPPAEPRLVCPACDWVCYRNPSPSVVIMITEGDRVLLGRHALSSFGAGTCPHSNIICQGWVMRVVRMAHVATRVRARTMVRRTSMLSSRAAAKGLTRLLGQQHQNV